MATSLFKDRRDAGRQLAEVVSGVVTDPDACVLGLPRGGIPVAYEIALRLGLPLDFLNLRKLGVPWQPELAMGAVGEDGVPHLDSERVTAMAITPTQIRSVKDRELRVIQARGARYRSQCPPLDVQGRTAILVDDGIATGATVDLAIEQVKRAGAHAIVLAVPVAPAEARDRYDDLVDHFVCLHEPWTFHCVGAWYEDFGEVSDDDVCRLLRDASERG